MGKSLRYLSFAFMSAYFLAGLFFLFVAIDLLKSSLGAILLSFRNDTFTLSILQVVIRIGSSLLASGGFFLLDLYFFRKYRSQTLDIATIGVGILGGFFLGVSIVGYILGFFHPVQVVK